MKRLLTWNLAPVGFCAVLLACSNGPPRPPSVSPRFAEFTLPPARSPQAVPSQPPSGSVEPTPFDSATLPVYPKGWFEPIVSYPELAPKEECLHASHCFVDIEATPRGVWLVGGALCAAQPRATDGSSCPCPRDNKAIDGVIVLTPEAGLMSVIFHDGKHELYKHYVGNKKWNDNSLLQLNPNSTNDWHLSQKNTESTITSLLERTGKGVKLPGFVTPLLTYITEEETASVIVVKGLHQPRHDGRWLPHITIGTEGRLFHLYYLAARLRLGALPEARGCLDWHCGPPPGRARDGAHAVPLSHRDVLGRSPESPGSRSGCACDQRAPAPRTSTMSSASKRASS